MVNDCGVVFRCVHKIVKSDSWLHHVCLSVCPHGTTLFPLDGFSWIIYVSNLPENLSKKFKFHSNLLRIMHTLHEDQCTFLSYLAHFLEWEMFEVKVLNCTIYEMMWQNIVEPGRPYMAIWRMYIACWIPKYKHKPRIYHTYWFSSITMNECASVLHYTYIAFFFCLLAEACFQFSTVSRPSPLSYRYSAALFLLGK